MDPVGVVVSALVVGATNAVGTAAGDVVTAAYTSLKGLIAKLLHGKKDARDPVKDAEAGGATRSSITDAVTASGVARDQAIVDAAVALLRAADAARPGIEGGIVGQINAAGGKVLVIGTNTGTINM